MARKLPQLNALKAFEAAARHESFTRAASELNVTQGAISHQVKALEADLGVTLFHRKYQRLELTAAGRAYFPVLRDVFDRIAAGTGQLLERRQGAILNVTTSPNFAAKWLVHKLGSFAAAHPDIDLRISASLHHVDFAGDEFDMAIRHSEGDEAGLESVPLFREQLFPVCSPKLLEGANPPRTPDDLTAHTLLHLDSRDDWKKWLRTAGADSAAPSRGPIFNQASMVLDAAVDGQGIALARTGLAVHDLLAGRLVRPFVKTLPVNYGYYIVYPKALGALRRVIKFRQWVLAEAERDLAALAKLEERCHPA